MCPEGADQAWALLDVEKEVRLPTRPRFIVCSQGSTQTAFELTPRDNPTKHDQQVVQYLENLVRLTYEQIYFKVNWGQAAHRQRGIELLKALTLNLEWGYQTARFDEADWQNVLFYIQQARESADSLEFSLIYAQTPTRLMPALTEVQRGLKALEEFIGRHRL
jgi:hypothetical protein